MTLLEKLKINLDYLLGKAAPELYAKPAHFNISTEEWLRRWETFSDDNGYIWYGVDSEGNVAQFACGDQSYVPEVFFRNVADNKKLHNYFKALPEITTTNFSEKLRLQLNQSANKSSDANDFWRTGANTGLFILEETENEFYGQWKRNKPPYELLLIPNKGLKISELPDEIQKRLEPFKFEKLRFNDCQLLDISQYIYCEE